MESKACYIVVAKDGDYDSEKRIVKVFVDMSMAESFRAECQKINEQLMERYRKIFSVDWSPNRKAELEMLVHELDSDWTEFGGGNEYSIETFPLIGED
jgi:hypothetical protein